MKIWAITGTRGERIFFVIMERWFVEKKHKKSHPYPYAVTSPRQNNSDSPLILRPTAHVAFCSTGNYPISRLQRGLGGPGERIQTMNNRYTLRGPINADLKRIRICVHGGHHCSHQKQWFSIHDVIRSYSPSVFHGSCAQRSFIISPFLPVYKYPC